MTKTCIKCRIPKDLGEFHKCTSKEHGRSNVCKPCTKEYGALRYAANPGARKKLARSYAVTNRVQVNAYHRSYARQCKIEAINHYGGVCACCGEKVLEFLSIDHTNGGGNAHRKAVLGDSRRGGATFYRWLKKNGWPSEFQVLCYNCNMGRAINGGVCPHQRLA